MMTGPGRSWESDLELMLSYLTVVNSTEELRETLLVFMS